MVSVLQSICNATKLSRTDLIMLRVVYEIKLTQRAPEPTKNDSLPLPLLGEDLG